ncbi:MAG: thioredoxin domain-containing protein [Solirubrobacteraceae bacterium]|jgi:protein-disulfide isomerase
MGPSDESPEIGTLLAGLAQSRNSLGSPAAPVTLEYFGDLQCPFCREFTLAALPSIIQRWVTPGKLRVEYHALETATGEPDVFVAQQVAALAAGRQGKAWDFIETFYREQREEGSGYVTETFLDSIAHHIPALDIAQWTRDRADPDLSGQIADDARAAENAGLRGTPSFLIGRTAGTMTTLSLSDLRSLDSAVETLLAT